jgi:molecular chaperone GrpE
MSDENVVDATVPPADEKDAEIGVEEVTASSGVSLVEPEDGTEAGGEVRELQARLRAVSAAYRQLQDEVEETKERLNRQAQFQREIQRGEILAKMFEPLNNLQRSLEVVKDPDGRKGLEMVIHQFMEAFRELGLEMFSPDGMPFDPKFHEALSVVPVEDPDQDGMVINVFSVGYRVGSRLLQPARVVIGKHEAVDA